MMQPPHTKRQEAAELSAAIKQTSTIQEKRRNQQFQRQVRYSIHPLLSLSRYQRLHY